MEAKNTPQTRSASNPHLNPNSVPLPFLSLKATSDLLMKRSLSGEEPNRKMKKVKVEDEGETEVLQQRDEESSGLVNLDENLVFEVLKHADARTLAASACVSKLWQRTAQDERLWEVICTRHWANIGCGNHQLRSVVLALGGFRRLHSLYIWPLSNPQSSPPTRWGKDEVNLSLSLLSIRFYEKMSSGSRNR